MNTGGPAFPQHGWSKDPEVLRRMKDQGGMTLLDWYAGQETLSDFDHPEEQMPVGGAVTLAGPQPDGGKGREAHFLWNAEWRAKMKYMRAAAMLAEKARLEVTAKDSLTVQAREVDDDYWAKFQDGIIITFEPGRGGWCASIKEGPVGSGNTIAEAIANLRACWEQWNVESEPATDHSGNANKMVLDRAASLGLQAYYKPLLDVPDHSPDTGKMIELQASNTVLKREVERLRTELFQFADSHAKLTIANRELAEALESLDVWGDELDANVSPPPRNCSCHISPPCNDCVDFAGQREAKQGWEDAKTKARAILAKHKGAA